MTDTIDRTALLNAVRDTVRAIEPEAEIILYGSRARGDAQPDSDWDFLILVPGKVDWQRKDRLRDKLFDLELETDSILSTLIVNRDDWATGRMSRERIKANVEQEGVPIG